MGIASHHLSRIRDIVIKCEYIRLPLYLNFHWLCSVFLIELTFYEVGSLSNGLHVFQKRGRLKPR